MPKTMKKVTRVRQSGSVPDAQKHSNNVTFRLSSEAYERVSAYSEKQGQTLGETIRQSLSAHLKLT